MYALKLPSGKLFIQCHTFQSPTSGYNNVVDTQTCGTGETMEPLALGSGSGTWYQNLWKDTTYAEVLQGIAYHWTALCGVDITAA